MKPLENKIRKKLEPWFLLICFFLILGLALMIQSKLEELFKLHFSVSTNNAIFGLLNFFLVCFFFFYYKKKFPELLSQLRFSIKYFLYGLFTLFVLVLIYDFLPNLFILKELAPYNFEKISWSIIEFIVPIFIGPILEEVFFRGILLRLFIDSYSLSWGIVLCGLSFAVLHLVPLPGQTLFSLFMEFFARWFHGILLSAVTYKTKNLSFAFGFHIANNFLAFLS